MKKKKNNLIIMLLILFAGLGIGYAFLTQELTINGISKVKANSWSVYFDHLVYNTNNVSLSTGDSNAEIDDGTNTSVSYTVTLNQPGDFYEFTVDVVNDGTIDAMVGSVSNQLGGVEIDSTHPLPNYLNYSVTYSDGNSIAPNHLLVHGYSETYKVRIEYKKNITASDLPETTTPLEFSFGVEYVQADENAVSRPSTLAEWTLPQGRTIHNLQVGDEICLAGSTTECFNFIKYDGNENSDVIMLAKYNLKVGNIVENHNVTGQIPANSVGYGLQSSEVLGRVAFSYSNYWYDNGLKPKYGSSFPADIYDSDYNTEPDFENDGFSTEGYSIAYYVEQYKNKLMGTGYGANIKSARLLTYTEATDSSIGCGDTNYDPEGRCPEGFIRNTSFWLGSLSDGNAVQSIGNNGYFSDLSYTENYVHGVRPILVVEKANM